MGKSGEPISFHIAALDSTYGSRLYQEDMSGFITGFSVGLGERTKLSVKWFYKDSEEDDAHEDRVLVDFAVRF